MSISVFVCLQVKVHLNRAPRTFFGIKLINPLRGPVPRHRNNSNKLNSYHTHFGITVRLGWQSAENARANSVLLVLHKHATQVSLALSQPRFPNSKMAVNGVY